MHNELFNGENFPEHFFHNHTELYNPHYFKNLYCFSKRQKHETTLNAIRLYLILFTLRRSTIVVDGNCLCFNWK